MRRPFILSFNCTLSDILIIIYSSYLIGGIRMTDVDATHIVGYDIVKLFVPRDDEYDIFRRK